MGAAADDLGLTDSERKRVLEQRAYEKKQADDEAEERASRERYGEEGHRALRQLGHVLRGGKPQRGSDWEPPAEKMEERGRARRQPPIIGTRG